MGDMALLHRRVHLGAALGLNLLSPRGAFVAGRPDDWCWSLFAILELQTRGYRRFELAISALLGIVFLGFFLLRGYPASNRTVGRAARLTQGLLPGLHGNK